MEKGDVQMKKFSMTISLMAVAIIFILFVSHQPVCAQVKTMEADMVIIGGGGTGATAALTAMQSGAKKVVLLEKESELGGTSATAGGFLWGAETHIQKAAGVNTNKDTAFTEHMEFNHYDRVDPKVVRAFIDRTAETMKWLEDNGIGYTVEGLGGMGGRGDTIYTQYPLDSTGNTHNFGRTINKLAGKFTALGGQILFNTSAEKILRGPDGKINGVIAADKKGGTVLINAKSVILATGGFTGNYELLNKYFPDYWNDDAYATLAVKTNTGDGIKLAEDAGAGINNYATLVREPATTYFDGEETIYSRMSGSANMWVNKRGERFQNETWSGNASVNLLLKQPGKIGYALFDDSSLESLDNRLKSQGQDSDIKGYYRQWDKKGAYVKISSNWDDIARWIGADPKVLKATIERYNSLCENGHDSDFNKDPDLLSVLKTPPFYAVKIGPLMIDTYGPVRINERMEVLDKKDIPIPGFFAGGAICGQIQGNDYHFFGGALGFAVTSGRIAGENAAKYISGK
jgi:fumarate reductase flavoprotein subunit